MADIITAALVQTIWTGDKEWMIKGHEEDTRQAAAQGAHVICFQELFYGPYFCQAHDPKYYEYAESESVPDEVVDRFCILGPAYGAQVIPALTPVGSS